MLTQTTCWAKYATSFYYYSQAEFELFLRFFTHLNGKRRFSYGQFVSALNSFVTECAGEGKQLPQFFESAPVFLQFLYEQNVICYIEKDEEGKDDAPFIRWCFRERTPSNLAPKVRTHVDYEIFYGLTKALNVGRRIRVKKEAAAREIGTVAWLYPDKEMGFIRGGPNQAEYYFKFDQVQNISGRLRSGDKVSYEPKVKYGKLRAENILRER